MPRQILSDRGTEFQGRFQELCVIACIDHRLASAYSQPHQGLVERLSLTFGKALRKHTQEDTQTWDGQLLWTLCGHNGSQSSTRCSPYRLLFGRDIALPMDRALPAAPAAAQSAGTPPAEQVQDQQVQQQEQLEQARTNLEKAQAQQQL